MSKTVYLRRLPTSNNEKVATEETKDYFDQANRTIGSFFTSGSVRPGTGLTVTEEDFLMPIILVMSSEDREFRREVTNFFHSITIKVPPHNEKQNTGGYRLEISLEDDNEPLSRKNLPINVEDYVRYRFAKAHPEVAGSLEEGEGNQLKSYYIYDEATHKKNMLSKGDLIDTANQEFFKIKDDKEKVNNLLVALSITRNDFLGKEIETLREYANANPSNFIKAARNKNTELAALLKELIEAGVIEQAGTRYLYKSTKDLFAASPEEAIGFFKDPRNSNDLLVFKEKVKEYRKRFQAENQVYSSWEYKKCIIVSSLYYKTWIHTHKEMFTRNRSTWP